VFVSCSGIIRNQRLAATSADNKVFLTEGTRRVPASEIIVAAIKISGVHLLAYNSVSITGSEYFRNLIYILPAKELSKLFRSSN
jgi:hypothetical protein